MLKGLKKQGISILVSTPYMDEAAMCDRVALMQSGRIMTIDTPQHVIEQFGKRLWAVRSGRCTGLLLDLKAYENTLSCHSFGEYPSPGIAERHRQRSRRFITTTIQRPPAGGDQNRIVQY